MATNAGRCVLYNNPLFPRLDRLQHHAQQLKHADSILTLVFNTPCDRAGTSMMHYAK